MKIVKKILSVFAILIFGIAAYFFVIADSGANSKGDSKQETSFLGGIKQSVVGITSGIGGNPLSMKVSSTISTPIVGDLRVEIIDQSTICLVGTYSKFLHERFEDECTAMLKRMHSASNVLPEWTVNISYNIALANIILKYVPTISNAFKEFALYQISDGVEIAQIDYWLQPQGQFFVKDVSDGKLRSTVSGENVHYTFIKLKAPLEDGQEYTLKFDLPQEVKFRYSKEQNLSRAIKINQLGYSPEAGRKYAYVGSWLGALGPLDLTRLKDAEFFLRDENHKNVFSGKLNFRQDCQFADKGYWFVGEQTYEADFSAFSKKGTYYVYIPTVGRSDTFRISGDTVAEAFYIHAKGLYHKRCGIAKAKPFTNWTMGECHMTTYIANFPPNNNHFKAGRAARDGNQVDENGKPKMQRIKRDYGFFYEDGTPIEFDLNTFALIGTMKTDKPSNLHGGWHDAADYDRRPYHYDVVNDLLAAYFFAPANFSDAQLNIPESGNGIPDIIDEAVWGMEVWLKAQAKSGAVPGWIEASSHPKNNNPSTDAQPYFLSASTMESTMQYAAYASMLSLALRQAGAEMDAKKYLESALKAYDWAINPVNRFQEEYLYPFQKNTVGGAKVYENKKVKYKEEPEAPQEYTFKAAFNLWLLTKNKKYLDKCVSFNDKINRNIQETTWRINPLYFSEFLIMGGECAELQKPYVFLTERMVRVAEERLAYLDTAYSYRTPWYPPSHNYVTHMAWGNAHPLRIAKFFMNAFFITSNKKFLDAAYLCNDWHNGANPMGTTMTSGLGNVYPVKFLDLPSYADGIEEYILGITPYRYTFMMRKDLIEMGQGIIYEHIPDRGFTPAPVMLLPKSILGDVAGDRYEVLKKVSNVWPVWRRYPNDEAFSVPTSEYTVSETISPAICLTGWLMSPNWKPSEKIKDRKPAEDITKLPGFTPLP